MSTREPPQNPPSSPVQYPLGAAMMGRFNETEYQPISPYTSVFLEKEYLTPREIKTWKADDILKRMELAVDLAQKKYDENRPFYEKIDPQAKFCLQGCVHIHKTLTKLAQATHYKKKAMDHGEATLYRNISLNPARPDYEELTVVKKSKKDLEKKDIADVFKRLASIFEKETDRFKPFSELSKAIDEKCRARGI